MIDDRCVHAVIALRFAARSKSFPQNRGKSDETANNDSKVAAIVALTPAEFQELTDYRELIGMIRAIGFDYVLEVAFGADLVADRFKKLVGGNDEYYISSDCPSIVNYVKYYHPSLVDNLAPVVSPMVAMSRVVKTMYGKDTNVVFIGPCIAKKAESSEIDEAITFTELREMLSQLNISPGTGRLSDFDPPLGNRGAIFPVTRGLLQTANINDDAITGNIIAAEGRIDFQGALKEFEAGLIKNQHMELLCCEGCIMGPGLSKNGKQFNRRTLVSSYANQKMNEIDHKEWQKAIDSFADLDLSVRHRPEEHKIIVPDESEVDEVLISMGKLTPKDHLNCGACGYETCVEHAIAITKALLKLRCVFPIP